MNEKKVVEIRLEDILPNRFQPRLKFNEIAIQELSESIKEHGVIQPIVVRQIADKYEIIAGERRYKASVMAGKTTIPAIITDLSDNESAEVALIENVQRQNLTPIEEAISYKKILDMGYLTQDNLATKLGKTQSTIANKLRLLNLEEEVQEALLNGKISERHARSLLKLSGQKQVDLLNRIINERLTVRATDLEVEKVLNPNSKQINDEIIDEPDEVILPNVNETVNELFKNTESNEEIKSLNIPTDPIIDDELERQQNNILNNDVAAPISIKDEENFENFTPSPIEPIKLNEEYQFNNNSEPIIDDELNSELEPNIVQNNQLDEEQNSNKFFNFDLIQDVDAEETEEIEEPQSINVDNSFDVNTSPFTFSPVLEEKEKVNDEIKLREPIIFEPINQNDEFTTPIRYDGIKNVNISSTPVQASTDIRTVINTIRSCANTVQKFGYKVDVREVEFANTYQVTFEIHKN